MPAQYQHSRIDLPEPFVIEKYKVVQENKEHCPKHDGGVAVNADSK